MKVRVSGMAMIAALGLTGAAWAQEPEAAAADGATTEEAAADAAPSEEPPPVEEPVAEPTTEAAPPPEEAPTGAATSAAGGDAVRFRFGVSGAGGMVLGGGSSFPYGGADLRFGVQVNDLLGFYAQPQFGVYTSNGASGGLFGVSTLAEVTLADRFFVAGGFGYAILNNPSGPQVHLRIGGYPLVSRSSEKVRRKGLMLSADLHFFFLDGVTFTQPTLNIGYEAF